MKRLDGRTLRGPGLRVLCAVMLAAGASSAAGARAASPAVSGAPGQAAGPAVAAVTSRVVPVPASVGVGGGAYWIGAATRIELAAGAPGSSALPDSAGSADSAGADPAAGSGSASGSASGSDSAVPAGTGREVADYAAALLRPATGYALPVVTVRSDAGADQGTGDTGDAGEGAGGSGDDAGATSGSAAGIVLALGDPDQGLGDEGYRLRTTTTSVLISARTAAGLFHGVQTLRQLLPASVESRSAVQDTAWTVPDTDIRDVPRYAYRGAMLDVARHFFTVPQVERYIDQAALYKINTLHLHLTDDQGWRIAVNSWPRLATYGGSTQVGGGPGGYYTQSDYREIVRYATAHFLNVVPEIDGPSHTNAALASYPELNCDGAAPPLYTGTGVGFSSLCVPQENTYGFLDDVIREVADLTPGPYLHIGGDEARSTSATDFVTFVDRVQQLVTDHGKTVIGWHQMDSAHPVPGAIAQYWGTAGNEQAVATAAQAGTRVIMSPANRSYLDMKYTADTPLGLSWAGYVDVKTSYDWDPATFVKGVPASAVYGVEAALWTETLKTTAELDYMAFPRLPGIAELGWSPAGTHDWDAYRVRLAAQAPRWDALGIGYFRSPQVSWPS